MSACSQAKAVGVTLRTGSGIVTRPTSFFVLSDAFLYDAFTRDRGQTGPAGRSQPAQGDWCRGGRYKQHGFRAGLPYTKVR